MRALILAVIAYSATPPPPAYSKQACNIESAIIQARAKLADPAVVTAHSAKLVSYRELYRRADGSTYHPTYRHGPPKDYSWRKVPIALLNTATCEVLVTRIERRIAQGKGTIVNLDPRFSLEIEDRLYGTIWRTYNTPLAIVNDSLWVVVGIKWLPPKKTKSIIYVPYSRALHRAYPELARLGQQHYIRNVRAALSDLRRRGAKSRAWPDSLLADIAQSRYMPEIMFIPLAEQTDHMEFYAYREHVSGLDSLQNDSWDSASVFNPFDRVMVILGANGDHAFNAVVSSAGARGMMQIMPRTCNDLRKKYSTADIRSGCTDADPPAKLSCLPSSPCTANRAHRESIKAAIAYFDNSEKFFRDALGAAALESDDVHEWRFGSYNGGAPRIAGAVKKYGSRWRQLHRCPGMRLNDRRCASLRAETLVYLEEFNFLWENSGFGYDPDLWKR